MTDKWVECLVCGDTFYEQSEPPNEICNACVIKEPEEERVALLERSFMRAYQALLEAKRPYYQEAFYEDGKMRVKPLGLRLQRDLEALCPVYEMIVANRKKNTVRIV